MEENDVCFGGSDALFATSWMVVDDEDAELDGSADVLAATIGMAALVSAYAVAVFLCVFERAIAVVESAE